MVLFSDINEDVAILEQDVRIAGQSELGFSIAVLPVRIPEGGLAKIIVRVSERRGDSEQTLDEIHREVLIEVFFCNSDLK